MKPETLQIDGAKLKLYLDGPDWNGAPAATIGDIRFKSAPAATELLRQAVEHARTAGYDRILGPMAGDTWHSYRFVSESDGSPAFLMEPGGTELERQAFHEAGFHPVSQYFSARLNLAEAALAAPPATQAFRIEAWDGSDPETLFLQVYTLSSQAFSGNAFYKPITAEAFLAMYMPFVPMLKRELIFFARRPDDSLAGFLFAIPNYAEGPASKTVILKTYASLERGAGRHLVHACQTAARALGFTHVIHALIHDANQSAERSAAEGGEIFRRYELLGLRL